MAKWGIENTGGIIMCKETRNCDHVDHVDGKAAAQSRSAELFAHAATNSNSKKSNKKNKEINESVINNVIAEEANDVIIENNAPEKSVETMVNNNTSEIINTSFTNSDIAAVEKNIINKPMVNVNPQVTSQHDEREVTSHRHATIKRSADNEELFKRVQAMHSFMQKLEENFVRSKPIPFAEATDQAKKKIAQLFNPATADVFVSDIKNFKDFDNQWLDAQHEFDWFSSQLNNLQENLEDAEEYSEEQQKLVNKVTNLYAHLLSVHSLRNNQIDLIKRKYGFKVTGWNDDYHMSVDQVIENNKYLMDSSEEEATNFASILRGLAKARQQQQ